MGRNSKPNYFRNGNGVRMRRKMIRDRARKKHIRDAVWFKPFRIFRILWKMMGGKTGPSNTSYLNTSSAK